MAQHRTHALPSRRGRPGDRDVVQPCQLLGGPYNYFGRDPASALRDTVVLRPDPKTGAAIPDKDPMALKPAADCTYHTADVPYRGPATAA
jgi:hypothetical protein